jgi:hypothetical protein
MVIFLQKHPKRMNMGASKNSTRAMSQIPKKLAMAKVEKYQSIEASID